VIQINITLLVQVINFLILLFILNAILYKPLLGIVRQREAKIQGDRDKAGELAKEVEDQENRHQEELAQARQTAAQEKAALLAVAKKEESAILDKARKEAGTIVEDMKGSIQAEAAEVRKSLQAEMSPLANSIAEKILGRAVG
jgi:F-type H+-transporting ATPase subunit b